MYTSIVILVVLASILMCLIVLIQESKGGGLSAAYSNNNQILGAPKTTNFVEKATWTLAACMIVLSILSVGFLLPWRQMSAFSSPGSLMGPRAGCRGLCPGRGYP